MGQLRLTSIPRPSRHRRVLKGSASCPSTKDRQCLQLRSEASSSRATTARSRLTTLLICDCDWLWSRISPLSVNCYSRSPLESVFSGSSRFWIGLIGLNSLYMWSCRPHLDHETVSHN